MRNLLSSLILLFSISSFALAIPTGETAKSFSLMGADGKKHSLDDYKGKTVVLEWFNKDCPYVVKHYESKNMQNLQSKYTAKDVVWLSVISSAPGKQGHLEAQEANEVLASLDAKPTSLLFDPEGEVGKMYDAKTTPHMFIINPQGTLVYQGAIDDKPSTKAASLKGATPLFANALDLSLAGKEIPKDIATNKAYGCGVKYK